MMNKIDFKTLEKINEEFGNFQIGQVMGGSNDVYLRFGYWNQIDATKLQSIVGAGIQIVEDDLDDDDCGTLWSYKLK